LQSPFFLACISFIQSRVSKIGFKIFSEGFNKFVSGFFARFIFSSKVTFQQSQFLAKVSASSWLWRFGKSILISNSKVRLVKNYVACKIKSIKGVVLFLGGVSFSPSSCQQSVHPTLGTRRQFQAFFYASAFFQSDGVPPPAPARVTQTVRPLLCKTKFQNLSVIGVK